MADLPPPAPPDLDPYRTFLATRWAARARLLALYALAGSVALVLFDWGFTRFQAAPPSLLRILAWRLPVMLVPIAGLAFVRLREGSPQLPAFAVIGSALWTWANAAGWLALGLGSSAYHAIGVLACFVCAAVFIPVERRGRLLVFLALGSGQLALDLVWPDGRPLAARAWHQAFLFAFVGSSGIVLEDVATSRRRSFLLRRELEGTVSDLTASRRRMAETAVLVAASAEQLGRSASGLVERAARSDAEGEAMVAASRELAQAAAALQARSRESAETASDATLRTSAIGGLIGQIEAGVRDVEAAVTRSEATFEQLQARVVGIGALVESARDVALQTHMLAVNAGIQSVSAGEHGKGFAVIAEEVRKLSRDSGQSSQEIARVVEDVRREMGALLGAIGQVRQRTAQFAAAFGQARATLEEIRVTVRALGDAMKANADDADAQAASSAGVSDATGRMAALLRQQAEVAADVAHTSAALAGHAAGLKALLPAQDWTAQGAASRPDSSDT